MHWAGHAYVPPILSAMLMIVAFAASTGGAAAAESLDEVSQPRPKEALAILDVPYVPQSEALCGGAALAMVFRYWGEQAVYAEDFAHLVDEDLDGIRTAALAAAVRDRGWRALAFHAERELVLQQLVLGRPVIALIEVRPGRYHYVVMLAWRNTGVLVHDPALAPFRVVQEADLLRAWRATGNWALLILPPREAREAAELGTSDSAFVAPSAPAGPCDGLVQQGVQQALEGDLDEAEPRLVAASLLCPDSGVPLRELAGIRFRQQKWSEAATLAARAANLDPQDEHVWRLLATSRFLDDDRDGALRAWNRLGEPRIDLVRIEGLSRIRYNAVAERLDLAASALLTSDTLALARRRLAEVPAISRFRLGYEPRPEGRAQVHAVLLEHPLVPKSIASLTHAAVYALTERAMELDVASPTGGGEVWVGGWRWWANRPAAWLSLTAPGGFGLPATVKLQALWEEQAYRVGSEPDPDDLAREARRRVSAAVSDWLTPRVKWQAGGAVDEWDERGAHMSLFGAVELRLAKDRGALRGEASTWLAPRRGDDFASWGAEAAWHVISKDGIPVLTARGGVHGASRAAPLALWPGAGTGHARPFLLRAHPLLENGIVEGAAIGRRLIQGTVEGEPASWRVSAARLALSGFVDCARSWRGLSEADDTPWLFDVGVGLRLRLPGKSGSFRIDAARAMHDGRVVFSAAWHPLWPD